MGESVKFVESMKVTVCLYTIEFRPRAFLYVYLHLWFSGEEYLYSGQKSASVQFHELSITALLLVLAKVPLYNLPNSRITI